MLAHLVFFEQKAFNLLIRIEILPFLNVMVLKLFII